MELRQRSLESLGMTSEFWKNKKVALTGHTGFKGSWLSLWLKNLEATLSGYSLPPVSYPSLFELANVADGMRSEIGDIRDLGHVKKFLQEHSPEILIHMAAQALVVKSHESPHETYTTNILGTLNMLEAVRQTDSVRVLVIITSDKCYQNKEWVWGYREEDSLGGNDPYSSSKACAELITNAYRQSYFKKPYSPFKNVAVATARAGNVIGGGDWAMNRLIPDVMRSLANNNQVIIRNPKSIRPWQFVLEPLRGYLDLVEQLWNNGIEYAEEWNFGPNEFEGQSVSWIAERLDKLWGTTLGWKELPQIYPHEASYLRLDCSKANQKLNWVPKLNISTTLEWVVDWYKSYGNNANIEELTMNQIKKYQNL